RDATNALIALSHARRACRTSPVSRTTGPGSHTPMDRSSVPLGPPSSDGQFVRRALIVAGVVALSALVWALSEIFLLVFGSVLLAVILRFAAAVFGAHTGIRKNWSLLLAGLAILGLVALAIFLFVSQLRGQFELLSSQLQSV